MSNPLPNKIMTLHGVAAGAGTAGNLTLLSDLIYSAVAYVQIPRGMAVKIWAIRMSGEANSILLGFSKTAALATTATATPFTPTVTLARFEFDPSLDVWLNDNLRHPIVIPAVVGGECFYLNYAGAGSKTTYVDMDVEFVPL